MNYLIAGLAVYKLMQLLNAFTPREAMPWVKITAGVVFGYAVSFLFYFEHRWTAGLVVATIASACHAVLRLITLHGDFAARRTFK